VRNHISVVTRRYVDTARASASEAFRGFQGAYLLTVNYRLEYVADYADYMKGIQVHINHACPHNFRWPHSISTNNPFNQGNSPLSQMPNQ